MFSPVMRAWVPLVLVLAVAPNGLTMHRMHGIFGSQGANADGAGGGDDQLAPFDPKSVLYEVFGRGWTAGSISYLDENSAPQRADFSALPWSFQVTTTLAWICANVVAQGTSATIGCGITVNGGVRENESPTGHDAQIFCLVKAA
ncbi:MAG TPA: MmpS family transport accessory protein [Mycobacterium sp.]|nr:MmpS family transport accessory protein [Mycobacterium sp.]HTX97824.1 MmpS family transport accessory protein [Mycobacterium sp.]